MSSIGSNKKYPATINDKKNIIFENNNSKFHIPDKYKNFYIVSKKDYFKFKNELESIEKVNPILKNEEDKILDFDTYTMDSGKGIKFLKNEILLKKKYVRSDEYKDKFVYQPEKSIILNPVSTTTLLNPVSTTTLLNPVSTSVLLNPLQNPKQNVVVFVNTTGGKKSKKIRKHKGIIQTGGNAGRLQKGYKYSGKRLKNGMPEILKVKSVKK